ncbi:metallophosphoesterase [Lachnospiraceae bacterium 54-53]
MKIGVISDIHIDVNKDYPVLEALAEAIRRKKLHCLVIAGDVSNNSDMTLDFIQKLSSDSERPVYFIPGNHDIWEQFAKHRDAGILYEKFRRHPLCLLDSPVLLDKDWVLTGETGWYDYSFGNSGFTQRDFERKSINGREWLTSAYADWHKNDTEVHLEMLARLESQFQRFRGKKIIAVTHMITDRYFTVPQNRENWDYFNAFLGSADYGTLFEKYGIQYSLMGHVHFRKRLVKNGVSYICSCLNYYSEWQSKSLETEISNALTVLEI